MRDTGGGGFEAELLGSSRVMGNLRVQLARLAAVPWPVRLEGPSGTGKGVAARLLHCWSPRCRGPFVALHLNMLAEGLEIAELVGHVRGAFTGATTDRPGAFEAAHKGTLFLDELAIASPRVQRALLQLVDEGAVQRLGEQRPRRVDVRLVFATNANLESAVVAGEFRKDLFYRLGSLVVRMPALSEHRDDIPELVEHILEQKTNELGDVVPPLSPGGLATLVAFDWPGNVRQLQHVLEYYVTFGRLPHAILHAPRAPDWKDRLDEALARHGGNKAATSRELGVSRKTVHDELRRRKA
jgi:DNA-binding NtrC family response regulator